MKKIYITKLHTRGWGIDAFGAMVFGFQNKDRIFHHSFPTLIRYRFDSPIIVNLENGPTNI